MTLMGTLEKLNWARNNTGARVGYITDKLSGVWTVRYVEYAAPVLLLGQDAWKDLNAMYSNEMTLPCLISGISVCENPGEVSAIFNKLRFIDAYNHVIDTDG